MRVFRGTAVEPQAADPNTFVGTARTKRLAADDAAPTVTVYHVEFDVGGRTNWHTHSGPQWLLVVAGRIRLQTWGEPPVEVGAGDAVVIRAGEKHWHGAAPGEHGAHLAVNVDAVTEWLEPVSDAAYAG